MPEYEVKHAYGAWRDGERVGPWSGGEKIELDDELAQWVNRDSPGALAAVGKPEPQAPAGTKPATGRGRPRKAAAPRKAAPKKPAPFKGTL